MKLDEAAKMYHKLFFPIVLQLEHTCHLQYVMPISSVICM